MSGIDAGRQDREDLRTQPLYAFAGTESELKNQGFLPVVSEEDRTQYEQLGWQIRADKSGRFWVKPVGDIEEEGIKSEGLSALERVQSKAYLDVADALGREGFQCVGTPDTPNLINNLREGNAKFVILDPEVAGIREEVWARMN